MTRIPGKPITAFEELASGKPYLGNPTVVEGLVRSVLADVVDLRGRQLRGEHVMIEQELNLIGQRFQQTFYGQNDAFTPFHWNQPSQLGRSIVQKAGLGGAAEDAVLRLAAKMLSEFLGPYLRHLDGKMDEGAFRETVNDQVRQYRDILLGLPAASGRG